MWLNDGEYVRKGDDGRYLPASRRCRSGNAGLRPRPARPGAVARAGRHAEGRAESRAPSRFTPDYRALVCLHEDDLFYWQIGETSVRRLTATPSKEEAAQFSPDGRLVAFVRGNNLYVVDLDGHERALTTDGTRGRPERQARLGLPGGDLRPRHAIARTGGAPTPRASRSCSSDEAPVPTSPSSITSRCSRTVEQTRLPEAGRSEPDRQARRRRAPRAACGGWTRRSTAMPNT